jgi:hypothetical protein
VVSKAHSGEFCALEEADADEGAGQVQEAEDRRGLAVVADREATVREQPGDRPLDDPAMSAEALGGLDATPGDPGDDAASAQGAPVDGIVVALVAVELLGSEARASRLTKRAPDGRDGVDQRLQQLGVVDVGGGQRRRERDALPVDDQAVLRAALAPVRRVRAGRLAPFFARTLVLSMLARSRSMASRSPSHCSNVRCAWCHTPASCHSRSRRQQLTPLAPRPRGTSRHRQPCRATYTIPASAARSDTRGRPPFGFGRSGGNNGPTASHSSSGTKSTILTDGHYGNSTGF